MRKVKITKQQTVNPKAKQQTVNPKAVYMGLSIPQVLLMAVGIGIALGAVALFIFTLKVPVNLVMAFVFVELLIFVGLAVIRINGMNLFKWIIVMFQSPIFRPYQSKGVLDRYEEEKEE